MHKTLFPAALVVLTAALAAGQTTSPGKIFDGQLSNMEHEVVPLAEAMPADKYNFAPTSGAFSGVRTFAQQARHLSYEINAIAAGLLRESVPPPGANENGPDDLKTKDQIIAYMKQAFAKAHRAFAGITDQNLMGETVSPWGANDKRTRLELASAILWHSFDHYGQMVEYARMNGIIPPASR
jgi:uncharacterized damage-inducible protein DinB